MNSENSKTSDLTDYYSKYVALSNLSTYYTWKNMKKSYKNNKVQISAPTWNEEFELPDALYSVSDLQDYFNY